ncbi:hypothetical protein ACTHRZ_11650, partial [Neisseria sp. P0001.S006]|uniref:hypothetical protein n=1 Tax=Neisseria sp. P0001.S006 TaxID=3436650 RepID=UPI003F7FB70E
HIERLYPSNADSWGNRTAGGNHETTEYIFRLSDETPKIEIDVKAAAIINGVGQDLYDRDKKELGFTGTFEEFLAKFKGERGEKGDTGAN